MFSLLAAYLAYRKAGRIAVAAPLAAPAPANDRAGQRSVAETLPLAA